MTGLSEEDIRRRAYHLWAQAGEPAGRMDIFWYQAEKELLAERTGQGTGQGSRQATGQGDVPPGMTDNLPV